MVEVGMLKAADDEAWAPWWAEPALPPVTLGLMATLVAVSAYFNVRDGSVDVVACNYKDVVRGREFWRVLVAPLAHKDPIHLIVSVLLLWDSRDVEQWIGPGAYARLVFHTVLVIAALHLGYAHFDASRSATPRASLSWSWHGMSGVIFALLIARFVLPYLDENSQIAVMGFIRVPAPCVSALVVIIYSAVAQKSVFMMHAIGTTTGVLFMVGLFDWVTPYLSFCALQWGFVAFVAGEGFPPAIVSDEVVAQRRIEERYASRARRRRSPQRASDGDAGNLRQQQEHSPQERRRRRGTARGASAGTAATEEVDLETGTADSWHDEQAQEDELAYLLDMQVEIPPRLQPGRREGESGQDGSDGDSERNSRAQRPRSASGSQGGDGVENV